jgi:hypothetical protein
LAQGQSCLIKVAEKKATNFELQAQLAKGICDLFAQAYSLTNDSLKKFAEEDVKAFLNSKRFFFAAKSFFKMQEISMEEFNNTGENFGKALAYQGYGVQSLLEGLKDIVRYNIILNIFY